MDSEGRPGWVLGRLRAQFPLLFCRNQSPKEKGAWSANSLTVRVRIVSWLRNHRNTGGWGTAGARVITGAPLVLFAWIRPRSRCSLPSLPREGGWEPRHL